jgi:two-component system, cell cycle response regulator
MGSSKVRVLLVEDDPSDALLIRKSLGRSPIPFHIEHCDRLASATAYLNDNTVDVVLLDLGLPDGVGVQNLTELLQVDDRLPIVIHTVQDDETSALEAMKAGAQDFLTKDMIGERHLVRALTYAIHRKRTELNLRDGARHLEAESRTDSLTRVYNRPAMYEFLDREWSRSIRSKTPFCCAVLDVDFFKRINDTFGHSIGDEVLVSVAELISDQIRGHDILCRFGGEEFCVLLPATGENAAGLWAERTRQAIHAATIPTSRGPQQMTVSIGIAQFSPELRSPRELLDHADQAMLVSKQRGRNKVTAYSAIDDSVGLRDFDAIDQGPFAESIAGDYMTTPIHCLRDGDSILAAARLLLDLNVNSVPIVDDNGSLVGIVSEKDLVELQPTRGQWADPIRTIMNTTVVSFPRDATLEVIRQFFSRVAMRRVVIVQDDRPVGVLSRSNLLRCFHDWAVANADSSPVL